MGNTIEEKDVQKQTQNNYENGTRNIHIDNYFNVTGLNAPMKRHRLPEWVQYICCLQETNFKPRDTYRLKVRGWKKIFHANGNQKKARVTILISDNIDFKIKNVTRGLPWWRSG